MKLRSIVLAAGLMASVSAFAVDVGVSVQVSQPGVYGRIDIGQFPQPVVVNPAPVIIARPAVVVAQPQPVYLWVPPGHQKHWNKHCQEYNACGVPVYFVKDDWYQSHVMAQQGQQGGDHGKGHGKGKGKGKGHDD